MTYADARERSLYLNGVCVGHIYRQHEIDEYWLVDWRERKVEIYILDYDENGKSKYYLWKIITESNKKELKIIHFPDVKITFDELFDEIEM